MERPNIKNILTAEELKKWYWLKAELVCFAKFAKVNYSGSKFELLERLADKFEAKKPSQQTKTLKISKVNWAKSNLSLNTIITDTYTNGPNVRSFFKIHCGEKFSFSIPFMNWMRENNGKSLDDAVNEWKRLNLLSRDKNFKSAIPESNQYNKYLRDFFADNPEKTIKEAQVAWKLKRNLPIGKHIYERSDLNLKEY